MCPHIVHDLTSGISSAVAAPCPGPGISPVLIVAALRGGGVSGRLRLCQRGHMAQPNF